MRFKKGICFIMAVLMMATLLAGCNAGDSANGKTLTVYTVGTEMRDSALVLGKINEILQERLGVTLEMQYATQETYDLVLSSGEDCDIMLSADWLNYWQIAQRGGFAEITDEDLQQYAPFVWENNQNVIDFAKYDGKRYAIPKNYTYAPDRCFAARGDLMAKYGIESLDSIEDVEAFLTAVAENEPDIIPFDLPGNAPWLNLSLVASDWGWQAVGSVSFGEHVYYNVNDPERKLFIAAEQPEMLEFTEMMQRWNQKGFFSRSVLSNKTSSLESFKSGRSALAFVDSPAQCNQVYQELSADDRAAWDVKFFTRYHERQSTYNYTNSMLSIPSFSKNKEDALRVINEIEKDQELHNLLNYGIEGTHYEVVGDGKMKVLDYEAYANTVPMYNPEFGMEEEISFPGSEELVAKLDSMSQVEIPVNCPVVVDGIQQEDLALTDVFNNYTSPRYYGIFDGTAEEAIATEIEQLKIAGIDKYMAELQRQLDEYMAGIE